MGNGVSTDQGNLPSHGTRDVGESVDTEQHDWSQLAEAPNTNTSLKSTEKPYSGAQARGPEMPSFAEDDTRLDAYRNAQSRGQKSEDSIRCGPYSDARNAGPSSSSFVDDNERQDRKSTSRRPTNECSSAANDHTRPNAYSGTKESSVMKDDNERVGASSGTRQSSRSTNNDQRRQRRRRKSSSSTDGDVPAEDRDHQEDGEVRAEDNGRRERRKKSLLNEARSSSTSTETALPKSTNTHAGASACTGDQYAEDKKSTYTMMAPALDLQEIVLPIIMQKEGFLPGS